MTVVVINKQLTTATSATVVAKNFAPTAPIAVYQLSGASTAIQHLSSISAIGGRWTASLPAQSITLFVVPGKRSVATTAAPGDSEQQPAESER